MMGMRPSGERACADPRRRAARRVVELLAEARAAGAPAPGGRAAHRAGVRGPALGGPVVDRAPRGAAAAAGTAPAPLRRAGAARGAGHLGSHPGGGPDRARCALHRDPPRPSHRAAGLRAHPEPARHARPAVRDARADRPAGRGQSVLHRGGDPLAHRGRRRRLRGRPGAADRPAASRGHPRHRAGGRDEPRRSPRRADAARAAGCGRHRPLVPAPRHRARSWATSRTSTPSSTT